MGASTKEAQRAELHKTIWRIANDLRGAVDGWDFKSYVLGILFYRFISENLDGLHQRGRAQGGGRSLRLTRLSDKEAEFGRKETVAEKGFYILPSELFANVRAACPARREPQRDARKNLSRTSRALPRAPTPRMISGSVRRSGRQQPQARQHRRQAQREAG